MSDTVTDINASNPTASLIPDYRVLDEKLRVADRIEALREFNDISKPGSEGTLPRIGLRIVPAEFDDASITGIRISELSDLAPEIRSLRNITVRGCFVNGSLKNIHGKELGRFFRASYESAKKMTVILPCAMPYICIENVLSALKYNRDEHPETLRDAITAAEIVAKQNETAFYAKLYVS